MLTKLAHYSALRQDGEPLVRLFRQGDSVTKLAGDMMPEVQEWLGTYKSDAKKIAVLVNALGGSEYWGQNSNHDIFPWTSLAHDCNHDCYSHRHPIDSWTGKRVPPYGYKTFLQAHVFAHHINKDPSRAFGDVALSVLNPKMKRVELVALVDRARAQVYGGEYAIAKLDAGEFPDVSMGCRVPYDVCSICGNKAKGKDDYCVHIKDWLGRILEDGRRVGMINLYPRFFDISFVYKGADKTAKVMTKFASDSGLWVPPSVLEAERLYMSADEDPMDQMAKVASVRSKARSYYVQGLADRLSKVAPEVQQNLGRMGGSASVQDGVLKTNVGEMANGEPGPEKISKYKKPPHRDQYPYAGKRRFKGLDILVENAAGTWRTGNNWAIKMLHDYGEIPDSKGVDGDPVDVYLGPNESSDNVYIVHQNFAFGPKKGQYDEDKVMLGFPSAKAAKKAYLAHYSGNGDFFRSITEMPFKTFKKTIFAKDAEPEKIAGDTGFELEELFTGYKTAQKKQRSWSNDTTTLKATGPTTIKLAHEKKADLDKEIMPSSTVGKIVKVLQSGEDRIPSEVFGAHEGCDLNKALATPSMMGMVLQPEEFQHLLLSSTGNQDLADQYRDDNVVFPPNCAGELPVCGSLNPKDFDQELMSKLLPLMGGRSFLGPVVVRRLAIYRPAPEKPESTVEENPLLTKVGAAYNWYRKQMAKVAADGATSAVETYPELGAQVYDLTEENVFLRKQANIGLGQAVPLAAMPLTLMLSASYRDDIEAGKDVGFLGRLIADHPYLSSLGTAALTKELLANLAKDKVLSDLATTAGRELSQAVVGA